MMVTTYLILGVKLTLNPQQLGNLAPLEIQSATMEFWKLLCLICSYNRTQQQLTAAGASNI